MSNKDAEEGLVIVLAAIGGVILAIGAFLTGIAWGLGLAALQAFLLHLLWNFTMPVLFGLPAIGFWQMWALLILVGVVIRWLRSSKN